MSGYGFKLDDFPGNMTVVMAQMDKESLVQANTCPADYSINNDQPDWLVISPTDQYEPEFLSALAENLSAQHHCKCIRFEYGDGAGVLVYDLYDKGERIQGYYFCPDYSEEMGDHAKQAGANETIVRNGEEEFCYFSTDEHPADATLEGGLAFLNQLFIDQKAEMSWEYLPG